MHVSYFENDDESEVNITKGEWHLEAERRGEHVFLAVREGHHDNDDCTVIFASLRECFTCEEWERLVCELSRVNCGPRECDECEERETEIVKVIVFDQDDCDDERERPKPKTRTARKN